MQGCDTYLGQLEEQTPSSVQVRFAVYLMCHFFNQHICAFSLLSRAQEALPCLALHKARQHRRSGVGEGPPCSVHHGPRTQCPQLSPPRKRGPARASGEVYYRTSTSWPKCLAHRGHMQCRCHCAFWHRTSQGASQ